MPPSTSVIRSSEPSPQAISPVNTNPGFDDEIDLLALIKAVLATWKAWLVTMVVASLIFGGYQLAGYYSALENAPYTKVISLTFDGANNGQYPNGSTYRVRDIAAPAVVQSVYAELGIADSGMSLSEFRNRLTVEPYTPYYREIMAKYKALLNSQSEDYDEIQALQARKRDELNKALNSAALISFDPVGTELPDETIREAIAKVPVHWARQAIADKGVLKSDIQLVSASTLSDSLFEDVDYIVLGDLLAEKIEVLRENISKVRGLSGSATVSDPQTGWTLSDLETNLHDLETYRIDELMSPIRSLGISRTPRMAAFYFEEKRQILEEELTRLEEESALIQEAYQSYRPESARVEGVGQNGASIYPGMVPQMGGEVFSQLIEAAGESSVEKYRQLLNDRWLAANLKTAEVKGDLREIDRLIAAVKGEGADSLTSELRDEYLQRMEDGVPAILSRLREFYGINWRIYEQISRERIGSIGYLYKDAHQGVLRASAMPSLKRTILLYIALMAAITFVVVPTVMIRNAMKGRRDAAATGEGE